MLKLKKVQPAEEIFIQNGHPTVSAMYIIRRCYEREHKICV